MKFGKIPPEINIVKTMNLLKNALPLKYGRDNGYAVMIENVIFKHTPTIVKNKLFLNAPRIGDILNSILYDSKPDSTGKILTLPDNTASALLIDIENRFMIVE